MHPFLRSLCATSKMITLNSLLNMHPLLKFLYRTDKTFTCSSLLAVILTYLAVGGGVSRCTFTGVAGHAVSAGAAVLARVTRTLVDGWSGQRNNGEILARIDCIVFISVSDCILLLLPRFSSPYFLFFTFFSVYYLVDVVVINFCCCCYYYYYYHYFYYYFLWMNW